MSLERRVHQAVQLAELARIGAEEVRTELADAGAHAVGVRRKVEGTERTDLAVADEALVRLDAYDRAVEDRDRLAAGPLVAGLVQGKLDSIGQDSRDLHPFTASRNSRRPRAPTCRDRRSPRTARCPRRS